MRLQAAKLTVSAARRPRVLILNWRDIKHPLAGGAEIALLEHARRWHDRGAEITWFASSFPGGHRSETLDGITTIRQGSHYTVHLWAWLAFSRGMLGEVDIIVDNFHFLPFFSPLYARRQTIIGFIHEVAKEVWYDNLPRPVGALGYRLEPLFFRPYRRTGFITVSESTATDLIGLGIAHSHISVIHNGLRRPEHFFGRQESPTPSLLFLGRISKDKGIDDALQIFSRARLQIASLSLWIAGKEERSGLLAAALNRARLTGANGVEILGHVTEEQKWRLLASAWLLVHPSRREGWGLTVIEAAAAGTPTVAYDVPGLRDSVRHQVTGVLAQDLDGMVEAVVDLLREDDRRLAMGAEAAKWSGQFDWDSAADKSWDVLTAATTSPRS